MVRSYEYAAFSVLGTRVELAPHARRWATAASDAFLESYFREAAGASFISASAEESKLLLDTMLLEKALYELRYELNNRPGWVGIPLLGILTLAGMGPAQIGVSE